MSGPMPAWVEPWVGLPFRDCGRGPREVDCYGLVVCLLRERLGLDLPALDSYSDTEDPVELATVVSGVRARWREVFRPIECDVVLFRITGLPCHVGVVVDVEGAWFLHAQRGVGTACERWDSPRWNRRVEGFYRWTP